MNNGHNISLPEALLLIAYVGIADLAGFALILVGLDDFLILDIATLPVTQIYFRMKGVRANFDLVMELTEILPYVGALPLKTIGVIGVIAMNWSSTASNIATVAKPTLQLVYQREEKENTTSEQSDANQSADEPVHANDANNEREIAA